MNDFEPSVDVGRFSISSKFFAASMIRTLDNGVDILHLSQREKHITHTYSPLIKLLDKQLIEQILKLQSL